MIKRDLHKVINDQINKFPVVAITGPRQSGKTTLAKSLFSNYDYYNLEDIGTKTLATKDPVAFINSMRKPAVIDEIQKIPKLLSQIQVNVDETKETGKFVITGSESLLLSDRIAQSLAGRVANNILLPLSFQELQRAGLEHKEVETQILSGFYPRIYDTNVTFSEFYPEYINTYVEKDVRQMKNLGDLSLFENFLQLLAGRVGQLTNLTSLSNDVGVSHNTIESWISILEASYIVYRLKPYYKNLGKRVIKSPKIYFYDTGLLCYLLGIENQNSLKTHYSFGNIFENFVINEIIKHIYNNKLGTKIYFYRDSNGNEVDLLTESATEMVGVEIKSAQTFSTSFLTGINSLKQSVKNQSFIGCIIYRGKNEQLVGGMRLHNFFNLPKILELL